MTAIAAVDLGASSGRVLLGIFERERLALREVHRFANQPIDDNGTLRWDIQSLFQGVLDGLRACVEVAGELDSIGVDGWGVDYGLLDADGQLLADPVHYRDRRTEAAVAAILDEIGAPALYQATGTQLQPFNTIFQLRAEATTAIAAAAGHALLVPDLVCYWLTGQLGTELTNASTSGLLDPRTRNWSYALAERARVPISLLAPLRRPGERLGDLRAGVAAQIGALSPVPVIAVPSHDTAAAVAGIPADTDEFAFVCTGTWALVGVELPAPVITEASRLANFTNEVGVDDTIRFLRNVTGFWLLQECVREWEAAGQRIDLNALTEAARAVPGLRAVIDVQDPVFAPPGEMPARVAAASRATSGVTVESHAQLTRCILDSLALAVRHAVREAIALTGHTVQVVHVVGGGVSNELFCQLVADACELPVRAGPAEAASWGNVLSQARALGLIADSLAEARRVIGMNVALRTYLPGGDATQWQRADRQIAASRGTRA